MSNSTADPSVSLLRQIYEDEYQAINPSKKLPTIEISYYPYVNINHTIRIRNKTIFVRISDLFKTAPVEIHRALAAILISKLLGKKVPKAAREKYRRFVNREEFQLLAVENKRQKGRKQITTPQGVYFDLDEIFGKINLIYFVGSIEKPILTWSKRKTYRRLGHYDPAHKVITISKSLDQRSVPKFVVEYVVYHEMLHIKHPTQHRNGRRYSHTPEFKRDERQFPYFEEAEDWIEKNVARPKKNTRFSFRRSKR